MIIEVADISINPEKHGKFKDAIAHGVRTVLSQSKGFMGHQILAGHEDPGRFMLVVKWATLEDHNIGFRESPAFAAWRSIIGPYFAKAPHVEHFHLTDES